VNYRVLVEVWLNINIHTPVGRNEHKELLMKPKTLEQQFKTARVDMLMSPDDKSMLRRIAKLHNTSMNELLTESFKQRYSLEINKIRYS